MDSAAALLLPAAAFDGSLRKQQQKPLPDAAALVGGSSFVDVFQIDDLLDFSNEDIAGPIGEADLVTATSSFSSAVPSVGKSNETIGACLAPCLPEKGTEQQHHTIKPQVDSEAAEIEEESLCIPVSVSSLSLSLSLSHTHARTHAHPSSTFRNGCVCVCVCVSLSLSLLHTFHDADDAIRALLLLLLLLLWVSMMISKNWNGHRGFWSIHSRSQLASTRRRPPRGRRGQTTVVV